MLVFFYRFVIDWLDIKSNTIRRKMRLWLDQEGRRKVSVLDNCLKLSHEPGTPRFMWLIRNQMKCIFYFWRISRYEPTCVLALHKMKYILSQKKKYLPPWKFHTVLRKRTVSARFKQLSFIIAIIAQTLRNVLLFL